MRIDRVPHLSIVVPLHNEAETLSRFVDRLSTVVSRFPWPSEVVAVDDASTDDTFRILRESVRGRPWLRVVRNHVRCGQHTSVLSGMRMCRGALVLSMDADLEDRPDMIPTLLAALRPEWDMVAGRRVARERGRARKAISWFLNALLRRTRASRLADNGSMMRLYRRPLSDRMVRWGSRRPFIPALALDLATSYGEVAVDTGEARLESRYSLRMLLHVASQLARSLPPTFDHHGREPALGFFDLYWSDRYRRCRKAHEYRPALAEAQRAARRYAEPLSGRLLLELGAGLGEDAASLHGWGARVAALDSCVSILRQWGDGGCHRVAGRAEELPFRPGVFDRVWGRSVLMHVPLPPAAEECRRVLRAGGKAVFIEPLKLHPLVVLYRALCSVGRHSHPRPLLVRDVQAIGRLFRHCAHREFYLFGALAAGFHALGPQMGARLRQKLLALDERLLRRLPALRGLGWISVMVFEK
jgi:glycosyltransferase involved in cell wall biosynthesis